MKHTHNNARTHTHGSTSTVVKLKPLYIIEIKSIVNPLAHSRDRASESGYANSAHPLVLFPYILTSSLRISTMPRDCLIAAHTHEASLHTLSLASAGATANKIRTISKN